MSKNFMMEAIRLAQDNIRNGMGGPFGAVVVMDGLVIGRGQNQVTPKNDPTAHAEIVAIRQACEYLGNFTLGGCDLYTSCEPCPMCLGAIYWARLDAFYYAANRKDAALAGFDDDFIYREFAMPADKRSLKAKCTLRYKALDVFKEWSEMEDKILY